MIKNSKVLFREKILRFSCRFKRFMCAFLIDDMNKRVLCVKAIFISQSSFLIPLVLVSVLCEEAACKNNGAKCLLEAVRMVSKERTVSFKGQKAIFCPVQWEPLEMIKQTTYNKAEELVKRLFKEDKLHFPLVGK
uniref:Uncharacterized protein n=1 Tax=Strigamia maritima TaxID=126957 RepID=T1J5H2_STRMM